MVFRSPKYYAELRKYRKEKELKLQAKREQAIQETVPHNDIEEANKPTSSQAKADKQTTPEPRVQASSQNSQAPVSQNQGTSAQAHVSGRKQQG